jgi:hypothetical protein
MGPKVHVEAMKDLCRPVTQEEVRGIIFKMGNNKVLGPNGYSALSSRRLRILSAVMYLKQSLNSFRKVHYSNKLIML